MENLIVSRNVNLGFEVQWISYAGNFLMTLNKDMEVDFLTHQMGNPLQTVTFTSGMIDHYYPGLSSAIIAKVKEHTNLEEKKPFAFNISEDNAAKFNKLLGKN
ncbi:hypothetical protein bcgnr5390_12500 [Bacillus luti]|nr:hypothetical protein BC2903_51180 [Bacillus cereus]